MHHVYHVDRGYCLVPGALIMQNVMENSPSVVCCELRQSRHLASTSRLCFWISPFIYIACRRTNQKSNITLSDSLTDPGPSQTPSSSGPPARDYHHLCLLMISTRDNSTRGDPAAAGTSDYVLIWTRPALRGTGCARSKSEEVRCYA